MGLKESLETAFFFITWYVYQYAVGAAAPVITKTVHGNNGTVSCSTYCAGTGGTSWNNELPLEWQGATCVSSSYGTCNQIPNATGSKTPSVQCVCSPNPAKPGWFKGGWGDVPNTSIVNKQISK